MHFKFIKKCYKMIKESVYKGKNMQSYMLSEIQEQPEIFRNILSKYISADGEILIELPEQISQLRIIASGSSYHCASVLTYLFKMNTDLDVNCDYSSEFILKPNFRYDKNTFYVFISQSGETSDTINALKKVKIRGIKSMCITNTKNSTLWNESDYKLSILAGKELSIASTKAFSAQILVLYLTMLKYVQMNGIDISDKISELKLQPNLLKKFFLSSEIIETISTILYEFQNIIILGNKFNYTIALEGALKIKETSYINVNAYPLGEFLHGHVAVLNNKSAIIAVIDEQNLETNLKNLRKIQQEYNPTIITISTKNIEDFDFNFYYDAKTLINKIFCLVTFFQLLAFAIAKQLNRDIDSPKGLKKVVLE